MKKHLIAPSVLAADFARLSEQIEMVNGSEADWFHLDVMDGRFVPNITFGMFIVEAIARLAKKPLDVHLMILEPEKYIEQFRKAGADPANWPMRKRHFQPEPCVVGRYDLVGRVETLSIAGIGKKLYENKCPGGTRENL